MIGVKKVIRDNRYLNWLLILSNWLFQGIPNADKTEKIYKISFTLIFWVGFFILLHTIKDFKLLILLASSFFLAHTLNWIVNGNFYILFVHRLLIAKLKKENLFEYLTVFEARMNQQNWAMYAASFGSICRGQLKDSSDIDISIVRKPGLKNALASIWFALKEKKLADAKGIPLEIYISDSPQDSVKRFAAEKNPVVISDPDNTIDKYYQEKLSIQEAKKLNNIL